MKKVVVITGASAGIGSATAKLLAGPDYQLVLGARREEPLKALVAEIEQLGGQAVYALTDVSVQPQVEALAKKAITSFGKIDVWLNNAGIMPVSPLIDKDIASWDRTIDTNIKGTLYGIGAALPIMSDAHAGQIINISSLAGYYAFPDLAVYSGTKWAVRAISESLRQEVAELGIRVTVVSPGQTSTNLIAASNATNPYTGVQASLPVERVAKTIKQAIDLPEDASWNEILIRPNN